LINERSLGREGSAAVSVEGLRVGYRGRSVLQGINLAVPVGSFTALIGANGAGKSTLLKAVAGLLEVSAGRVSFDGGDVTRWSVHRRIRFGLGYIVQNAGTFSQLTAGEHLRLARALAKGREGNQYSALTDGLLAELEIDDKPAWTLSGGQRRALAIATVLAQAPKILLCDEPTGGLAPGVAAKVLELIAGACRAHGLTVICVEQRIRDVLAVADRAALLTAGCVQETTTRPHDWMLRDGLEPTTFGHVEAVR
jgi:ABC-type branched-subunit amino acid transport system ATPase component